MSIVTNDDLNLILLLLALVCSAAACCLTAVALLKNQVGGARSGFAICGLFGGALILLCVNCFAYFDLKYFGVLKTIFQLCSLAGLAAAIWMVGRIPLKWSAQQPSRQKISVWSMFISSLIICIVCSNRMQASGKSDLSLHTWPALPGEIRPINSHVGLTDKGRVIDLFCFELKGDLPEGDEAMQATNNSFPAALIRRKEADLSTNCHGWVFANGTYLINSSGVSMILEDNDYIRVASPKTGDVAVYRNAAGNIIHTAIVCSVLADNTVLLESKWGVHQRFIHLPEDQPYSTLVEYFETSRGTHGINIIEEKIYRNRRLEENMGG
jgi:hypothetical protein